MDAFHNYNPDSGFSKKLYIKRLRDFDTCRVFLSDYLGANLEISDEPITELDDLITDQYLHAIDDNRKQRSAEELKADIESYIPTVCRSYEIMFDMLRNKDSRCRSLDMYTLMIANLEYYPFFDFEHSPEL